MTAIPTENTRWRCIKADTTAPDANGDVSITYGMLEVGSGEFFVVTVSGRADCQDAANLFINALRAAAAQIVYALDGVMPGVQFVPDQLN